MYNGCAVFYHNNFMEITLEKTSDCLAELRAVVPADIVEDKKKKNVSRYAQQTRIPGFRPGKAPLSVIARRYAKELTEELHDDLRGTVRDEVLEQNPGMKVLDFGELSVTDEADGSCTVVSQVTLVPQFELPEYMGLEIEIPGDEPSESEVDKAMQSFAESAARFEPVERAAQDGDIVVIDFKTSVEGKPTAEYCGHSVGFMEGREGYHFALGQDNFIPGLSAGLVGASAGESRQVLCTMREEFVYQELAGKEVLFDCTVKEVQEKRVPELSVELFEGVVPGSTLEEIREGVREHLLAARKQQNEELKADRVAEKLGEQLSFSLPEDLVERELANTTNRHAYDALRAGKLSLYQDISSNREEYREETVRNLRVYFALLEIAERENIFASDQEVWNSIQDLASQRGEKNLKAFVRKLQKDNSITGIRLSIVTSKVIDLLVRNAKVTTVSSESAPEGEPAPEGTGSEEA